MIYYEGQQQYSLQLSAQDYQSIEYIFLQELLPKKLERQVETMTAYHEASRTMTIVGTEFPSATKCTVWVTQINDAVNGTTPLYSNVEIDYLVSKSPAPLDVAYLKISRVIADPSGRIFTVFTNGEVHLLDVPNKTFQYHYSLISDEDQLSENHTSFLSWGHVFDTDKQVILLIVAPIQDNIAAILYFILTEYILH